jgi:septum formation protein
VQPPLIGALSVAVAKARAIGCADHEIVVAADTLVVIDDDVLGKPDDATHARQLLQQLRGHAHRVVSGVALRAADGRGWGAVVSTEVVMRDYSDTEIDEYVARGEPFDKAGGYAIQDARFRPVDRVDGCYLNVVGLPLCAVAAGLNAMGTEVKPAGVAACEYCRTGAPLVSVG